DRKNDDASGVDASPEALVRVIVRADEAGHDDRAGTVDPLTPPVRETRPDRDDLLPLDQHVSLFKVAHLGVQAEHNAALQQDPLPPVAMNDGCGLCWRGFVGEPPGGERGGGKPKGARLEKVAA